MVSENEITSTEKLLDLIKDDSQSGSIRSEVFQSPLPDTRKSPSIDLSGKLSNLIQKSATAGMTIGVDIGYQEIKLVKIFQPSDRTWRLLDFQSIPFETEIDRDGVEFQAFLKQCLSRFCKGVSNPDIWSGISSAHAELTQLYIPKVPEKQIANAVYWTFKKAVNFDAEQMIFDYEVQRSVVVDGVEKIAILAYYVPRNEVTRMQTTFRAAGFELAGVTIAPFSIQTLFRADWFGEHSPRSMCNLYIGRNWSRIDVFADGNLVLVRGIKTGLHSMAENIIEEMGSLDPEHVREPVIDLEGLELEEDLTFEEFAEIHGDAEGESEEVLEGEVNINQALKILLSFSDDSPLAASEPGFHLSDDQKFEMIVPAMERLIRQVERTFQHYMSVYSGESINKIFVSGDICRCARLVNYISDQLGIENFVIDPLKEGIPYIGSISPPSSPFERMSYTPAMGLALANNSRTPNFLYTYKHREQAEKTVLLDRITALFLIVTVSLCGLFLVWQSDSLDQKQVEIQNLNMSLSQYEDIVDERVLLGLASNIIQKRNQVRTHVKKAASLGVLKELSNLTANNITLLQADIYYDESVKKASIPAREVRLLDIEGFVSDQRQSLEPQLSEYVIQLAGSRLFDHPDIRKSQIIVHEGREILYFVIHVEIADKI